MRLYDTARQAVVPFEPNELVLMYTCGITPYDATHLGHAATFISYDVLQRRLIDKGHTVSGMRSLTSRATATRRFWPCERYLQARSSRRRRSVVRQSSPAGRALPRSRGG